MEILSSSLVRFEAGAAADAPVATKATYSGKFYDASGTEFDYAVQGYTERIDWTANKDIIRIYSPQAVKTGSTLHWDDYKVSAAAEDKEKSVATIAAAGGANTGLAWGAGSPQDFYAMFPAPGTAWPYDNNRKVQAGEAAIEAGTVGAVISGVIPASQVFSRSNRVLRPNMNYAYMYAKATGATPGSSVSLEFSPLVTVVTFTLQLAASNHFISGTTVNSIKLSTSQEGAYLSGKFSVPVTSAGLGTPVITEGSNEVSLAISTALTTGQIMASNAPMTFTFFTLPTDQTKLTLTIGFSDGTSRTLDLKNGADWVSVPAGRKLFVNNLGLSGDDFYTITVGSRKLQDETHDYRLGNRKGSSSVSVTSFVSKDYAVTRTPVPWEIVGLYYDEACENPVDEADIWVTDLATNDNYAGTDAADRKSATLSFKYKFNDYNLQYLNQAKISNDAVAASTFGSGSSTSNYYNLSNPQNMESSTIMETANCYIVNGAGYYRIPLVVGNGIVGGQVNPNPKTYQGWEGKKSRETFRSFIGEALKDIFNEPIVVTTPFYDYKQQVIQNVYLHKTSSAAGVPTSAFVVWEDVDGMVEVADARYTLPTGAITKEGDVYWLNFHVAGQVQGNAVIAVADASGAVMWSWHIWETDYVPANYAGTKPYPDQSLGATENVMPRHLGYVYADYSTDERTIYVKVRQKVLNETGIYKTAVGTIVQKGNRAEYIGRNPFFAWGRKDAFWPGDAEIEGEWSNRPEYYGRNYRVPHYSAWEKEHQDGVKLGFLIANPGDWRTRFNYFSRGYPELEETIPYGPGHAEYYENGALVEYEKIPKQAGQVYAYNLWSAENYDRGSYGSNDTPVVKTIYDPCPAGYHMPGFHSFDALTNGASGQPTTDENHSVTVGGITFPLTGFLHFSSAYVKWNNLTFRVWGATPERLLNRRDPNDDDNDNDNYDGGTLVLHYDTLDFPRDEVKGVLEKASWHRGAGCAVRPVINK